MNGISKMAPINKVGKARNTTNARSKMNMNGKINTSLDAVPMFTSNHPK